MESSSCEAGDGEEEGVAELLGAAAGYFWDPCLSAGGGRLHFVAEGDLWIAQVVRPTGGERPVRCGPPRRLTSRMGCVRRPRVGGEHGRMVAFSATVTGSEEVFVMPALGGPVRQLTWLGTECRVVTWSADGAEVVFASPARSPQQCRQGLWAVPASGGPCRRLAQFGQADAVCFGSQGRTVIGRHCYDPYLEQWKGYRGGTMGRAWYAAHAGGKFRRVSLPSGFNIGEPTLLEDGNGHERLYFVADAEKHGGDIFCLDLPWEQEEAAAAPLPRRLTGHEPYYARHLHGDGDLLAYCVAGRLWTYDVSRDAEGELEVPFGASSLTRQPITPVPSECLEHLALHGEGRALVAVCRGRAFELDNLWEGPAVPLVPPVPADGRIPEGVVPPFARCKVVCYLASGHVLVLSDAEVDGIAFDVFAPAQGGGGAAAEGGEAGRGGGECKDAGASARRVPGQMPSAREWLALPRRVRLSLAADCGGEATKEATAAAPAAAFPRDVDEVAANPSAKRECVAMTTSRMEIIVATLRGLGGAGEVRGEARVVDRAEWVSDLFGDLAWSPCGRWLAYVVPTSPHTSEVRLHDAAGPPTGPHLRVTPPWFKHSSPTFDPDGEYLAFLSARTWSPEEDEWQFGMGFSAGVAKPHLALLTGTTANPFHRRRCERPKSDDAEDTTEEGSGDDEEEEESDGDNEIIETKVEDGLMDRILQFPLPAGRYRSLRATSGGIFYTRAAIEAASQSPAVEGGPDPDDNEEESLHRWTFAKRKEEAMCENVADWTLSGDGGTLAVSYVEGDESVLKVAAADVDSITEGGGGDERDGEDDEAGDDDSSLCVVALDERLSLQTEPAGEWTQAFFDVWRRYRDRFYDEAMGGCDWVSARNRWARVLPRCANRIDVSDVLAELISEVGAGHTSVVAADLEVAAEPEEHAQWQGTLAAEVEWVPDAAALRLTHVVCGDTWSSTTAGPLSVPGVQLSAGDFIVALDRRRVMEGEPLEARLCNHADKEVYLTFVKAADEAKLKCVAAQMAAAQGRSVSSTPAAQDANVPRSKAALRRQRKRNQKRNAKAGIGAQASADYDWLHTVRVRVCSPAQERCARHRDWVNKNLAETQHASGGRLGYVHVPDMEQVGYAEFHRYWVAQADLVEGFVIDLRGNDGGFVSELLLDKLLRRPMGFNVPRPPLRPSAYPMHAVAGPLVLIADEHSCSDGDILPAAFKQARDAGLRRGSIVGTRTWGGVMEVGASDADLVDGGSVSVPQQYFYSLERGYGIENAGVEPDIIVDVEPADSAYNGPVAADAAEADPMLKRAIEEGMRLLAEEVTTPKAASANAFAVPSVFLPRCAKPAPAFPLLRGRRPPSRS